MNIDLLTLCQLVKRAKGAVPNAVAISNRCHAENPEDGYDEDFMQLNVTIDGYRIGRRFINTEKKQTNVQSLKFGDHLHVRDNDPYVMECGWIILENTLVREATPERRGLHSLLIATSGLRNVERDRNDPTIHHTVMQKLYNYRIPGNKGRCVYKFKS